MSSSASWTLLVLPYSDLLSQFEELRSADGCYVEALGELLLRWVRHVCSYTYCRNATIFTSLVSIIVLNGSVSCAQIDMIVATLNGNHGVVG